MHPGLLVAWSLLWAAPAAARDPASHLVSAEGQVEVLRGSYTLPVAVGLAIQPGDVIRTGDNARAAILLTDGSRVMVTANSTLQIKQVSPGGPARVTLTAAAGLRTILQFFLGESWLRAMGPAVELELETLTATAVIKG